MISSVCLCVSEGRVGGQRGPRCSGLLKTLWENGCITETNKITGHRSEGKTNRRRRPTLPLIELEKDQIILFIYTDYRSNFVVHCTGISMLSL